MKIPVFNQEGKEVGQTLLSKETFEVPINLDLVHQVVVSQMANRRKIIAHVKDRGEVRGGGRKPWRQKGTGRARHGSIRSPLWRGGGVTFGPTKERAFKQRINKKVRRKALSMVLSAKAKEKLLIVLDNLKSNPPGSPLRVQQKLKTKEIEAILKRLPSGLSSSLIVLPKADQDFIRAARNIPNVKTIDARNLNVLDLLSFKYLILPKEAIKSIQETFIEKSKIKKEQVPRSKREQSVK